MDVDRSLQIYGIRPPASAIPEIRELLAQEAAAEREGRERVEDMALLCAVQLFSYGLPEDIFRIWSAKQAGMDLGCVVDVQFLCGPGLEATKEFLAASSEPEAGEILAYIARSEAAGVFEGFSKETHLDEYRAYFDVA